MSGLDQDFFDALELLGRACARFQEDTGYRVVIVGGAAVSFYTQGRVLSGDFDMVASSDFEEYLLKEGFCREEGAGRFLGGFYHPETPRYSFELVSGALFDGRSARDKIRPIRITDRSSVTFPVVEDLIADRLGQYASSYNQDATMLRQAQLLLDLASAVDWDYLKRRVSDEGGDLSALRENDA